MRQRHNQRLLYQATAPPLPPPPDEAQLAAILAEIEHLSDDEAARLLAEERP